MSFQTVIGLFFVAIFILLMFCCAAVSMLGHSKWNDRGTVDDEDDY